MTENNLYVDPEDGEELPRDLSAEFETDGDSDIDSGHYLSGLADPKVDEDVQVLEF